MAATETQHVYFAQAGTGPIKIGVAFDVEARIRQLQPYCPRLIRVLHVIENGGMQLERTLHMRFGRHWLHHEWFRPDAEILCYIADQFIRDCLRKCPPEHRDELLKHVCETMERLTRRENE
jgi:hypothetical protein